MYLHRLRQALPVTFSPYVLFGFWGISECSSDINWCLVLEFLSRLHLKARADLASLLDSVPITLCCFRERENQSKSGILCHLPAFPRRWRYHNIISTCIHHLFLDFDIQPTTRRLAIQCGDLWCLQCPGELHDTLMCPGKSIQWGSSPSSREYKDLWGWLSYSVPSNSSVAVKPEFLLNLFIDLPVLNTTQTVLSFCLSYLRRI